MTVSITEALANRTPFAWLGGHDSRDTAMILRVQEEPPTQRIPTQITGTSSTHIYTGTTELGGDRHAVMLEGTQMTIRSLAFFAWAFVALAVFAGGLASWVYGAVFTVSNLWFLAAAIALTATGMFGRRPGNTLRAARADRTAMIIGLTIGIVAFTVAAGLLAMQVAASLLFL